MNQQGNTQITHIICPDSPTAEGIPQDTHHLMPQRRGRNAQGEPTMMMVCTYCGRTEGDLRDHG